MGVWVYSCSQRRRASERGKTEMHRVGSERSDLPGDGYISCTDIKVSESKPGETHGESHIRREPQVWAVEDLDVELNWPCLLNPRDPYEFCLRGAGNKPNSSLGLTTHCYGLLWVPGGPPCSVFVRFNKPSHTEPLRRPFTCKLRVSPDVCKK